MISLPLVFARSKKGGQKPPFCTQTVNQAAYPFKDSCVPLQSIAGVQVKRITSYPFLWGLLNSTLFMGSAIIVDVWFPWIADVLGRHEPVVQAVYFTIAFFLIWIFIMWNLHRRRMFWKSFLILLLLHVTAILVFSLRFRPLLVREWTILGVAESYLAAGFVYLLTRRSRNSDRLRN